MSLLSENSKNLSLVIYGKGNLTQVVRQTSLSIFPWPGCPYFPRKHRLFLAFRQCLELSFPQAHRLDGDPDLMCCLMEEDAVGEQGNHFPDLGRPLLGRTE